MTEDEVRTVCSLDAWKDRCGHVGLPFVPAEKIASVKKAPILEAWWEGEERQEFLDLSETLKAHHEPGFMFRWDVCAPLDIKQALGHGQMPDEGAMTGLLRDDPRAFDLLMEFPPEMVAVWKRPWIEAYCIEGYPVEFRVFVDNYMVIGVSSYYPQRPLGSEWINTAFTAAMLTAEACRSWDEVPSFSLDWMVTKDNLSLIVIEGGPPHTENWGAHPCCFAPGEIRGIALEPREGAIT